MQARKVTITWSWEQDRQVQFLRACGLSYYIDGGGPKPPVARILLYGGSAGGGKTSALLIAGLIAAVTWPGCKVGYFRREYPQLEGPGGAIQESHQLYSAVAKWHGGQRRWTFPGGSILQFCHCKNEEDIYGYQSLQFDVLLIDESTQFTEFQLRYLLTRNRATVNGIIPFCAMATNPGGVSHGYHRKYFVDAGPWGQPVDVEIEEQLERHIFIPARLKDNIILEQRDPGYRKTMESMPEDVREALLNGRWDIFSGQYFKTFRKDRDGQPYHVVPVTEIPKDWRRFGSIDWGFAAPCAVYWHTIIPSSGRVITYRELYVTRHRAAEVASLFVDLSKYKDGEQEEIAYVKMSPDAWHERGLGSKASPGETVAEEFFKKGINVEPADNRRILGWNRMREYLSPAPDGLPWWQIFETCTNLVRTLPEMVHCKRRPEDISRDGEDHACFIAGTMVETQGGEMPIERIKVGQKVLTRKGYKRVKIAQYVDTKPVYVAELSNGIKLTGTLDHPIWVKGEGFVPLINLNPGDILLSKDECEWNQKALFSTASRSGGIQNQTTEATGYITGPMAGLLNRVSATFTRKYGKIFTEEYPKVITFTTRMRTHLTITLKIWIALLDLIISQIMVKILGPTVRIENSGLNALVAYGIWPQHGTGLRKEGNFPEKTLLKHGATSCIIKELAINVAQNLKQGMSSPGKTTFAPTNASRLSGEEAALMKWKGNASFAAVNLDPTNTPKQKPVPGCAVQVLDIYPAGTEKVYNISVEGEPEYFANGILVHNCESSRYALMSRPSPNEGEMFMPGAAEHYRHLKDESDEDDFGDAEEVAGFYGV